MSFDISTKKGDTWNGLGFEFLMNGSAVDLTSALIRMQVKKLATDATSVLEFSTEDGSILIDDAVNGLFSIPALIIDIPARNYEYDVEITLSDGRVITPFSGVFTVVQDVTR